jgi:hypothetical protein
MGAIKQWAEQALRSGEETRFIAWCGDCCGSDMPIDRERRIIDPQRWATEWWCGKNDAAQHRHTTQTSLEATCDHLKIESTLSIEQRSCCDNTETGDVRRRFWSLDAQIAAVGERQAIVSAVHAQLLSRFPTSHDRLLRLSNPEIA